MYPWGTPSVHGVTPLLWGDPHPYGVTRSLWGDPMPYPQPGPFPWGAAPPAGRGAAGGAAPVAGRGLPVGGARDGPAPRWEGLPVGGTSGGRDFRQEGVGPQSGPCLILLCVWAEPRPYWWVWGGEWVGLMGVGGV